MPNIFGNGRPDEADAEAFNVSTTHPQATRAVAISAAPSGSNREDDTAASGTPCIMCAARK